MGIFRFFAAAGGSPQEGPTDDGVAIDTSALTRGDVPVFVSDANREYVQVLKEVIDPELGVNIVDLGLVYVVELIDQRLDVVLTMTTPVCPLSAVIEADVKESLLAAFPELEDVRVAIIFDPPWSPEMMSDEARAQLGF